MTAAATTTERAPSIVDLGMRVRVIRALLTKLANVEAKLEHATRKADEYQRSIGQHINEIKKARPGDWERIVKEDCGIARARAYELMAIADGTKTAEQVRDQNNTRKIKHRKAVRSRNGREPLPDCPLCEGKGSFGPVDIYSPCGSIMTTGMRPDCDCLTMKRRGNPSLYDDLRARRAKLDALPASERTTKVGTSIVTKEVENAPPPEVAAEQMKTHFASLTDDKVSDASDLDLGSIDRAATKPKAAARGEVRRLHERISWAVSVCETFNDEVPRLNAEQREEALQQIQRAITALEAWRQRIISAEVAA